MVQVSHPYMTGKTIALTRWTFVGQVISLVFNMLSKVVITFLPRSKHLLISWLQSLSSATLEPSKINSVSIASSSICHEVMGPDAMIFQFSSVAQLCLTLWDPMNHSTPGFPVHHQLLEFTQIHAHWVGDAIQPSHPLSSPSPPAPNPSQHQGLFQWVNSSHQVAKVLEFQLSISPSNEHPGLISFRMDWLDLFAVQGTLKSLLQHPSSKASILWCSAFFTVQLSYPYMTRRTSVGKVMSLLFNMLSRLVITFLPRSKHLLISWLQSPSAVILEPLKK